MQTRSTLPCAEKGLAVTSHSCHPADGIEATPCQRLKAPGLQLPLSTVPIPFWAFVGRERKPNGFQTIVVANLHIWRHMNGEIMQRALGRDSGA